MIRRPHIAAITLMVADYDAALSWYRDCLGFVVLDRDLGGGKRWVTVTPPGGGVALLLGKAANDSQERAIGAQTGGRVFLFLHTDDFARDHAAMSAAGSLNGTTISVWRATAGMPADSGYGTGSPAGPA